MTYTFKNAKAVWGQNLHSQYNRFLGFHTELSLEQQKEITFYIAARSYYRLYLDGMMVANGPARTAKGYCRVDKITKTLSGCVQVAIEVAALGKPENYCNDCTMEPGLLTVEIADECGNVLAATGTGDFRYQELEYRKSMVETMSHSRGILEVYDLNPGSLSWITGESKEWKNPVPVDETVKYLNRRAPYADYHPIEMESLMQVSDMIPAKGEGMDFILELSRMINPTWYSMVPQENLFLQDLGNEKDTLFTGTFHMEKKGKESVFTILPGENPAAFTWSIGKSELGFIEFTISAEQECTVDIINSDELCETGTVKANSYVTRWHLEPGTYHLTTFEPKLTRYIKAVLRTQGKVTMTAPRLLDDAYPDENSCFFQCSDGDLNMIYDASRRTLRLNTLDIFMDCPQRERGGWLCDSHFTSHGAWQLLGDLSVEKDFIENFMLTDPDVMWNSFFPEVYPGTKKKEGDAGLLNWSFWLLTELKDYYDRSGDKEFIENCRERVRRFVEGMLSLRGESGLLEGMDCQFVDWSLSNKPFCLGPISVPNNCLAVCMLEKMAELYQVKEWKDAADEIRAVIEKMDETIGTFDSKGDAAIFENGKLRRGDCTTESGIALELWSGFHRNDKKYIQKFVNTMGTCPKFRADPNIGKSNLFIGLMIRFDVLAKLDYIDTLVREWKDLYLPQIKEGAGTLFEGYAEYSGCHGFNAAVGALLTNKVLGLGQPMQRTKTVKINPHPQDLRWASGSAKCEDGTMFFRWNADSEEHILDMTLLLPDGWKPEIEIPFELNGWTITLNGVDYREI